MGSKIAKGGGQGLLEHAVGVNRKKGSAWFSSVALGGEPFLLFFLFSRPVSFNELNDSNRLIDFLALLLTQSRRRTRVAERRGVLVFCRPPSLQMSIHHLRFVVSSFNRHAA